MPVKQIRGIDLVYDDIGQGQPIVFIHGHPFNRSMWTDQIDFFKDRYRLILPDLRGYGGSGLSSPRSMLDEMALDTVHLLESLAIDKAAFCGLSMGGQIVLDLYRLFPQKFTALIIADSDARGETPESHRQRLAKAEDILKNGMIKHTDDTIHQYISASSMKNPKVYAPLYEMMSRTRPEGAAAAHRGRADRRDHTQMLPHINVPSLIIVGSEDFFTPLSTARIMSDSIPGARLVVVEGAGHLPNMEAPEIFNNAVNDFLAAQKTGG
jgi:pimeloyl-ACP methyl ester carboxylesterase